MNKATENIIEANEKTKLLFFYKSEVKSNVFLFLFFKIVFYGIEMKMKNERKSINRMLIHKTQCEKKNSKLIKWNQTKHSQTNGNINLMTTKWNIEKKTLKKLKLFIWYCYELFLKQPKILG